MPWKQKPTLYTLPHGIEIVGEYRPSASNRYWRVRVRPHPFFPGVRVQSNGLAIRRSRVILASKLGRALQVQELAHHRDGDTNNDSMDNIELLSQEECNRHHKTGTSHAADTKQRIGQSLKRAYASGLRSRPHIRKRDSKGRISP